MNKVLIFGAGKVGGTIAHLLHHSGDYEVTVADRDADTLDRLLARLPVQSISLEASDHTAMLEAFSAVDAVVSAGPY